MTRRHYRTGCVRASRRPVTERLNVIYSGTHSVVLDAPASLEQDDEHPKPEPDGPTTSGDRPSDVGVLASIFTADVGHSGPALATVHVDAAGSGAGRRRNRPCLAHRRSPPCSENQAVAGAESRQTSHSRLSVDPDEGATPIGRPWRNPFRRRHDNNSGSLGELPVRARCRATRISGAHRHRGSAHPGSRRPRGSGRLFNNLGRRLVRPRPLDR